MMSLWIVSTSLFTLVSAATPDATCPRRIVFLPQTHAPLELTYDDMSSDMRGDIARSQLKIVDYLDRHSPVPLFSEQMTQFDSDATDMPAEEIARLQKIVDDAFPHGFDIDPDDLTELQIQKLVDNGADTIQLMRRKLTLIHRVVKDATTFTRIFAPIDAWFATHDPPFPYSTEIAARIYGMREREALGQIVKFFASHPDEPEVAIVYGSNHNFSFYSDLFPSECITVPPEFFLDWRGRYRAGPEGFPPGLVQAREFEEPASSRPLGADRSKD
jgi:hypothetical protein